MSIGRISLAKTLKIINLTYTINTWYREAIGKAMTLHRKIQDETTTVTVNYPTLLITELQRLFLHS